MTKFPFAIDGVDFSDVVQKYGYETDAVPVYSRTITTINKVDHMALIRTRGKLTITTNPVKAERAAAFCTALLSGIVTVSYRCFQTGNEVSQRMRSSGVPLTHVMQNAGVDWMDKTKITFEEL